MNKTWVIARREFLAAVRSKTFVVSLFLMPLLMFGGAIAQQQAAKIADTNTYKIAVVDRTEGGRVGQKLAEAAARRNEQEITDPATGRQTKPRFEIELVEPAPESDQAAVDRQRLELSDRLRAKRDGLLAYVEVGRDVTSPSLGGLVRAATQATRDGAVPADGPPDPMAAMRLLENLPDEQTIQYRTDKPALTVFRDWLSRTAPQIVTLERMRRSGTSELQLAAVAAQLVPPPVSNRGLARRDAAGNVTYESAKGGAIATIVVPAGLSLLMLMIVIVAASPLVTAAVEEKQQRIAEVLLGGVTPFQLMLGKLIGGVGTALVLGAIYVGGLLYVAHRFDVLEYVRVGPLLWFALFSVLAIVIYGALFLAGGAATTNTKEAQMVITPVVLVMFLPFFFFTVLLQYPSGALARGLSWFPLSAPMTAVMRAAIPGGAAAWELVLSALLTLVGTAAIVWVAGRVFRVGMLANTRPGSAGELVRWIVKG